MDNSTALCTATALAVGSAALYVASVVKRRNKLDFMVAPHSMRGRTAVVTGGNSGIGRVVAAELSGAGAATVLACRDLPAGERVAAQIRKSTKNDEVSVIECDLTSRASIDSFVDEFEQRHSRCDVLVLNAGVMRSSYNQIDGVEQTFYANYLGHWALTQRMLGPLRAAHEASGERARVVSVASRLEKRAPPILRDDKLDLAPHMHSEVGPRYS